jgi:hypothetical protein
MVGVCCGLLSIVHIWQTLPLGVYFALAGVFLPDVSCGFFNVTVASILQLRARDDVRGRVMAMYSIGILGSSLVGAPLFGTLADTVGVSDTFLIIAAICASTAVTTAWSWLKYEKSQEFHWIVWSTCKRSSQYRLGTARSGLLTRVSIKRVTILWVFLREAAKGAQPDDAASLQILSQGYGPARPDIVLHRGKAALAQLAQHRDVRRVIERSRSAQSGHLLAVVVRSARQDRVSLIATKNDHRITQFACDVSCCRRVLKGLPISEQGLPGHRWVMGSRSERRGRAALRDRPVGQLRSPERRTRQGDRTPGLD